MQASDVNLIVVRDTPNVACGYCSQHFLVSELDFITCLARHKQVFRWQVLDPAASVFSAGKFPHHTMSALSIADCVAPAVTNSSF